MVVAKHLIDSSDSFRSGIGMCEFPNCITFNLCIFSTCVHLIQPSHVCNHWNNNSSLSIRYFTFFLNSKTNMLMECMRFKSWHKKVRIDEVLCSRATNNTNKGLRWIHFKCYIRVRGGLGNNKKNKNFGNGINYSKLCARAKNVPHAIVITEKNVCLTCCKVFSTDEAWASVK